VPRPYCLDFLTKAPLLIYFKLLTLNEVWSLHKENSMSQVYSIVYQPQQGTNEPPYHYTRIPAESVKLIANHGIEGDVKAGHNPLRQLNIMSFEMQEALREEGFKTQPGELGEQITIQGFDVDNLPTGTLLEIGDEAVIRINKPRTPCDWFELIQAKPMQEAENRVGVMGTVIHSGVIRVGDPVKVLIAQPS
jgi:MOSC domain-containing protein YiiM